MGRPDTSVILTADEILELLSAMSWQYSETDEVDSELAEKLVVKLGALDTHAAEGVRKRMPYLFRVH